MAKPNSSAGRYRYEYLKHLQKNAFPIVLYLISLLTVSIAIILFTILTISPMSHNCSTIRNLGYNFAIESGGKLPDYRHNYKLENLVTFHCADRRINVNTYLDSMNGKGIQVFSNTLNENEVVISQKIADRLHVSTGDTIQIDLPIYDSPSDYRVLEVIPYVSDYYQIEKNTDFAVAFLGYDVKLETQIKGKYVFFLNDLEYTDFMQQSYDYSQKFNTQIELTEMKKKIVLFSAFALLLLGFVFSIYHILIDKVIKREVTKYCNDCFPVRIVKAYYSADYLFYSSIPMLIINIILLTLNSSLFLIVGFVSISVIITILWGIRRRCFEKAS